MLFDLLQAIDQGVPVDKKLPGGFRNIQIVLKELIDSKQCFLVQGVDGILLEHLGKENITQGGGQLIDQAADAQILIIDNGLFRVEYLTHINSGLGFLVGIRQLTQMLCHSTHTDHGLDVEFVFQFFYVEECCVCYI